MTIKQVNKSHYDFNKYVNKSRWNSFYHQIYELIKTAPDSILEVGVGSGITKGILKDVLHYKYETIDIDEELNPDYIGSVLAMPFADSQFDVIGCFQVLEHLPFENFETALSELFRVANKAVILSLPNAEFVRRIHIPGIISNKLIKIPFMLKKRHVFDGEHFWEINKVGYELSKIIAIIQKNAKSFDFILEKEYRVYETPGHHFFVLKKR